MKAKITCKECGEQFETGRIPKDRTCPECRELKRKEWADYQKQIRREALDNLRCTECGTTFKAKNWRKNPVCPECRELKRKEWADHQKQIRREALDNLRCTKCGTTFKAKNWRKNPVCPECRASARRKHHDNGYCHNCKKIFQKTHRAGDVRLCADCYKDFRRKVNREQMRVSRRKDS